MSVAGGLQMPPSFSAGLYRVEGGPVQQVHVVRRGLPNCLLQELHPMRPHHWMTLTLNTRT